MADDDSQRTWDRYWESMNAPEFTGPVPRPDGQDFVEDGTRVYYNNSGRLESLAGATFKVGEEIRIVVVIKGKNMGAGVGISSGQWTFWLYRPNPEARIPYDATFRSVCTRKELEEQGYGKSGWISWQSLKPEYKWESTFIPMKPGRHAFELRCDNAVPCARSGTFTCTGTDTSTGTGTERASECPKCHKPTKRDARFCAECGQKLKED